MTDETVLNISILKEHIANLEHLKKNTDDVIDIERANEDIEVFRAAIKALEQEPCEDEYIKVPKKALKYRTAGMIAYNVEWLKNHFDIERVVICGAQEPCGDAIDRSKAIMIASGYCHPANVAKELAKLPSVKQEPKTVLYSGDGYADGYMVYDMAECPNCGYEYENDDKDWGLSFCPSCGQKLNWESEG